MTYHLAGTAVGNIKVLSKHPQKDQQNRTLWLCKCICGNEFVTPTHRLTAKPDRQQTCCGNCQWHVKRAEAYNSWQSLTQRCLNPNSKDYMRYGGRGIKLCARWMDFVNFYLDMGDPPKDIISGERLSIDRKENNGNYEPNNCKWSTRSEQQLNKG